MKNTRTIVLTGIAATGLAVFTAFIGQHENKSWYTPSAKTEVISVGDENESQGFRGAAEWWFNRMKNVETGEIDLNEVIRINELARQTYNADAAQRGSNPGNSVASASWTELGPDNIGGRTRAIIFDNQDPTHQHMFAGGVSGGLWESNDAAGNWHRCAGFFAATDMVTTVVTIAQAPNGDLYVGTGEGNFYYLAGTGVAGFTGNGIFKSTDRGATWSSLTSTQPTSQNSTTNAWLAVNKIQVDPFNSQHIYAGTNKGLKISSDGGASWVSAVGPSATAVTMDIQVASNGSVIAVCSNKPWLSTDGGATFVNVGTSTNGWTTATATRVTISIAPSDPNFVYAFLAKTLMPSGASPMLGVYVSINGGNNWTQVCGSGNAQFDPFGGNGQGTYDNIVSVDPANKHRAIFGGTALYEWTMVNENPISGQWNQIAMEFPASIYNPYYVHSDKHEIKWHPSIPGVFYVGTDGGIFRTLDNGNTYTPVNSGYNVTQCYSVGIENTSVDKRQASAGCQDNGTIFLDGTINDSLSANSIDGGDGGHTEISFLNPQGVFTTIYFGALARSSNRGSSSTQFYDTRINTLMGTAGFSASFVTPIRLWESTNDLLSSDSIIIANTKIFQNKNVTDGTSLTYTGTLSLPTPIAVPTGTIVQSSVVFICGTDTIYSDASGFLSSAALTGGWINTVGNYSITFQTAPQANKVIKANYYLQYGAGTVFTLPSNVAGKNITHTIASQINPDDTVKVQDIVQSHLAVGFTGNSGIWLTRRAIDFASNPLWIKIAGTNSKPSAYSGESSCLAWTPDGDHLFVGTSNGNLYRLSNIGTVSDSAHGDVDFIASATSTLPNDSCQITCTLIGSFSGRAITAIDVNPNNPDQVVVSLGNYSNTTYVYITTIATTATSSAGTFVDRTGNLDNLGGCPTYSISFDKYATNRVLVGTEHGVYETSNIIPSQSAASPTYTLASNGFDVCPVDMIRQQRWEPWQVPNAGCFYIGTHGRGIWRDDSSWQIPTGVSNPSNPYENTGNVNNNDLHVFPNPVVDNSNVSFILAKQGDVTVQIYDLTGKIVYSHEYENRNAGTNTVQFETAQMVKGTYLITVLQGSKRIGSGRFIKMN